MLERLPPEWAAALAGAMFGVVNLWTRLGARARWHKLSLVLSAFVCAVLIGYAAGEQWGFGPGMVGAISWLAGNVALSVIDSIIAVVGDVPWIKRQLSGLIPGKDDEEPGAR